MHLVLSPKNFNPRSREGSDGDEDIKTGYADVISIHAPAKGATINLDIITIFYAISIHAPAKGATPLDSAD